MSFFISCPQSKLVPDLYSQRKMKTYQIRLIHGGDARLRTLLGFGKNIAVNCNGFVSEGVYPED